MVNPDIIFGRMGNRMFQMAALYAFAKDNKCDLYFQNAKFFDKYTEEIKALFGEGIGFLPYVSIHVRIGSNPINPNEPRYDSNPFYTNLLKTDYYQKAIKEFPNKKFLVFSDDPQYCRTLDIFKNENFSILDKKDEIEDFNLMASCEGNILANSSFSWWAGYLNPNFNKKVVCPLESKYYSDGIVRTVYPKDFLQLDFKDNEDHKNVEPLSLHTPA
jgi:hypothetical protein